RRDPGRPRISCDDYRLALPPQRETGPCTERGVKAASSAIQTRSAPSELITVGYVFVVGRRRAYQGAAMSQSVSDFLVERLHAWGVRRMFGYPGDGSNGVFGALNRAKGKIEFIQVRHEEMAAFMASAYAKFTGELGVCIATSGPGASHLITGLYDARLDHMPVLAITGQQARAALGGHYQQEVDLPSLFKDVAGAFVQQ